MKQVITLSIVAIVSFCGIAIAQQYGADANQSAIVGHESQQQAVEGQQQAQQDRMYGSMDANKPMMKHKDREAMEEKAKERHAERMAELRKIRATAQEENATKTVAALDKYIAEQERMYNKMMNRMERKGMKRGHMDANSMQ